MESAWSRHFVWHGPIHSTLISSEKGQETAGWKPAPQATPSPSRQAVRPTWAVTHWRGSAHLAPRRRRGLAEVRGAGEKVIGHPLGRLGALSLSKRLGSSRAKAPPEPGNPPKAKLPCNDPFPISRGIYRRSHSSSHPNTPGKLFSPFWPPPSATAETFFKNRPNFSENSPRPPPRTPRISVRKRDVT